MLKKVCTCRFKCAVLAVGVFTLLFFVFGFHYGQLPPESIESFVEEGTYTIASVPGRFTPVTVPVNVYSRRHENWIKDYRICRCHKGDDDFPDMSSIQMDTFLGKINLRVYNHEENPVVQEIKETGDFEPKLFRTLFSLLRINPGVSVISFWSSDLGAFAVQFAKLRRPVIHVDTSTLRLRQMCATLLENDVEYDVTLLHGQEVQEKLSFDRNCQIQTGQEGALKTDPSIFDKILKMPNAHQFRKVLLIVNLHGVDLEIFRNSDYFFHAVTVRGILIEWKSIVQNETYKRDLINLFQKYGFKSYILKGITRFEISAENSNDQYLLWLPSN